MPKRQVNEERKVRKVISDFIVVPALVLLGIFVARVFVESLFSIPGAIKYIFLGIGGTSFLVYYFRKKIGEA